MGEDSCSESQHRILNIFTHLFVVKIVMFVERTKINEKGAGDGPIKKDFLQMLQTFFNSVIYKGFSYTHEASLHWHLHSVKMLCTFKNQNFVSH